MKPRRLWSLFLTLILLLQCVYIPNTFAQTTNSTSITKVKRVSPSKDLSVGEEYTITHTLEGEPQQIQEVEKEIVLVLDVSGSMDETIGGKKRLVAMKEAAKGFIDKFVEAEAQKVKIALVPYASTADNPTGFYSISSSSSVKNAKDYIDGLIAKGATNIGDGIRRGYHILLSGNEKAAKYMIVMTDGQPQGYTQIGFEKDFKFVGTEFVGTDYYGNLNTGVSRNLSSFPPKDYKVGNSVNGQQIAVFRGDLSGEETTKYAKDMAKKVAQSNAIKSFFIGFSADANRQTLNAIAREAKAKQVSSNRYYYDANDAKELSQVFTDIQAAIVDDLSFKEITYTETLPSGVEVVSLPEGFTQEGNKITGKISATMKKNNNKYVLDAEPFDIRVKFNKPGVYTFENASLTYTDPFNVAGTAAVDPITVNVAGNLVLDKNVLYIEEGSTAKLTATIQPKDLADDIQWIITEGNDISSFVQGEISTTEGTNKISITGNKVGKAVIQASYIKNDIIYQASCEIYVYKKTSEGIHLLVGKSKTFSDLNLVEVPSGVNVEYISANSNIAEVISNTDIEGKAVGETTLTARLYKKIEKVVDGEIKEEEETILTKEYPVYVYDIQFEAITVQKESEADTEVGAYGYLYPQSAFFRLRFHVDAPDGKTLPGAELTMKADFKEVNLTYNNPAIKDIILLQDPTGTKSIVNDRIQSKNFDSANNVIIINFNALGDGIYEAVASVNITSTGSLTMSEFLKYVTENKKIQVKNTLNTLGFNVLLGTNDEGEIPIPVAVDPSIR